MEVVAGVLPPLRPAEASLPACEYLPGAWLDLDVAPARQTPVPHAAVRAVHGMVTGLLEQPHLADKPLFALAPWPSNSLGWVVYVYELERALRVAGRATCGELMGRPVLIGCSGARRVQAPPRREGASVVEVTTITPVCLRRVETLNAGTPDRRQRKHFRRDVDEATLRANLRTWLQTRLGLTPPEVLGVRLICNEWRSVPVRIGGKQGTVAGLAGRLVAEVDGWALWALRAAEVLGLGGRVGFGFGRIVVR